ncbi:MAG: sel1 repeat family protein [Victivallales bacterium]|nr:sel1 repeat family protein [Victivallales bacterium]
MAQNNLGELYEFGKGVAQNYGEATKWYLKAAEQGYADAQFNLGACHEEGHGVSKDYGEAVKWYRKAAAQGNTKAQKKLGAMYGNEATSGATKDAAAAEAEIMKILLSINRNNIFKTPNFNEKKLNNAIMSYAPGVERTDILLHSDDTAFGGAKEGCIITRNTLYFKELLSKPGKVRIEKGFIFSAKGHDIMLGDMKLLHLTLIEDWELRQIVSMLNILAASAGNN